MGSPLGPLLTNIFMKSLEDELIPNLTLYLCNWRRYVNDTHAHVNPEKVGFILTKLNLYHPNIQFTFELEKNKQTTFLDVLVKRTSANHIENVSNVFIEKRQALISISTGIPIHQRNRKLED